VRPRELTLILLLFAAWTADAGGLRDLDDAWLIPPRALAVLIPAGPAPASQMAGWSLLLSQGRLFGLEELPQLGVAAARRWPGLECRLHWERLGDGLYREDQAGLEVLAGRRWRVGGQVGLERIVLAGDPPDRRLAMALRLDLALGRGLRAEAWWPLRDPPPWYGEQGLRRWLRLSGRGEGWVWAAVLDRRGDGTPALQAELMLRLAPIAALGLRIEPWSGAVGTSTAVRLGAIVLRSSHLVHPELGTTHRWGLLLEANP
jgi:hypothetical protein